MAVIAIERVFASGGEHLGQMLAERLGYKYVDKWLLEKIAQALYVSEETLASFEEGREYWISNLFLKLVSKKYIGRIVGHDKSVIEEEEYQESLRKIIRELAKEDNVVIIGRAAHYILKDMKECYRFRIVAPLDYRIAYAAKKLKVTARLAEEIVEKKDRNHEWFLRSICGDGYNDPLLFHLTINMGHISFDKAVSLILTVLNQ